MMVNTIVEEAEAERMRVQRLRPQTAKNSRHQKVRFDEKHTEKPEELLQVAESRELINVNPTVAKSRDSTEKSFSDKKIQDLPLVLLTEQNEIVEDYDIAVTTKAAKEGGGRVLFS